VDKQEFINQVKDGAVSAMKNQKILASLTIAQAILESGWGESELAKAANNLFGIKRWGYLDYVEMPTTEYRSGEPNQEKAEFRKYSSWDYSIADHTAFLLQNDRYKNLIGVKDYKQACTLIQQDGYATDSNYANLLIQIIEENDLQKYDSVTPANPVIASIQMLCNSLNIRDYNGNALVVDGISGPFTSSALSKLPLIKKGSRGELVKWLQERLIDLGFSCGPCGADGDFGYCTLTSVQNFQAKHGLSTDGIVGPLTLKALLNLC
jgi:hypothetical protein